MSEQSDKIREVHIVPLKMWLTQSIYYVGMGYILSRLYTIVSGVIYTKFGVLMPFIDVATIVG